jgi:demethylmacrocin O-methyltransferase
MLESIKTYLRTSLDETQRRRISRFQALKFRGSQHFLYRIFIGSNLKALATIYGTDKWGTHWYAQHYETHFAPLRRKRLNILEIGIGGYDDPQAGGNSLRAWRTYFPKSRIYGIDIHDKSLHDERRIKTFRGSQVDEDFLAEVLKTIGRVDIVIDDGSHENEHVLCTFKYLFPRLSENGIYVIEDTQTSYWQSFGGSSDDLHRPDTTMGFLKALVDGLNYAQFEKEAYEPNYYDKHLTAIHFYHNIVFLQKGTNNERRNI